MAMLYCAMVDSENFKQMQIIKAVSFKIGD